jgi:hypothetical protein
MCKLTFEYRSDIWFLSAHMYCFEPIVSRHTIYVAFYLRNILKYTKYVWCEYRIDWHQLRGMVICKHAMMTVPVWSHLWTNVRTKRHTKSEGKLGASHSQIKGVKCYEIRYLYPLLFSEQLCELQLLQILIQWRRNFFFFKSRRDLKILPR